MSDEREKLARLLWNGQAHAEERGDWDTARMCHPTEVETFYSMASAILAAGYARAPSSPLIAPERGNSDATGARDTVGTGTQAVSSSPLPRFNCGVDGVAYTAAVEALNVNGSPAIGAAQIVAVLRAVRAVVAPLPSSPLVVELVEALETIRSGLRNLPASATAVKLDEIAASALARAKERG